MKPGLYDALAARAFGRCECGCGRGVPPGHCDHFFGRSKAAEVEYTCWILHPSCDFDKTNNRPSSGFWLLRFAMHCRKYVGLGYREAEEMAHKKLAWLRAKGTSGEAA